MEFEIEKVGIAIIAVMMFLILLTVGAVFISMGIYGIDVLWTEILHENECLQHGV